MNKESGVGPSFEKSREDGFASGLDPDFWIVNPFLWSECWIGWISWIAAGEDSFQTRKFVHKKVHRWQETFYARNKRVRNEMRDQK